MQRRAPQEVANLLLVSAGEEDARGLLRDASTEGALRGAPVGHHQHLEALDSDPVERTAIGPLLVDGVPRGDGHEDNPRTLAARKADELPEDGHVTLAILRTAD